jgi:hypothetical protein
MTQNHCPNGDPNCPFDREHELALVSEIMRLIRHYFESTGSEPCPLCLRNTLLAVAALAHLEAARIEAADTDGKRLRATFAKAAREGLEAVSQANAAITRGKSGTGTV